MTVDDFLRIISDTLNVKNIITMDTNRADVNEWDSMGQVLILSMLEDTFKVTLQMEELVALKSVRDIANILRARNIFLE